MGNEMKKALEADGEKLRQMTGEDHGPWDLDGDCSNCGGEGFVESCFEDTCVCLDPPCHWSRCDYCNHDGKKSRAGRP